MRARKKRGKASRKDNRAQDRATRIPSNEQSPHEYSSEGPSPIQTARGQDAHAIVRHPEDPTQSSHPVGLKAIGISGNDLRNPDFRGVPYQANMNIGRSPAETQPSSNAMLPRLTVVQDGTPNGSSPQPSVRQGPRLSPTAMSLNGFSLGHECDRPGLRGAPPGSISDLGHNGPSFDHMSSHLPPRFNLQGLGENTYNATSPTNPQHATASPGFRFSSLDESPLANFLGASPIAGSPAWLNLPTPPPSDHRQVNSVNNLRFPVLRPLLPHIESIMPISLACDLLELYFTSSSTVHLHPVSPYVLGYLFRKQSFLDPRRPRACSPALLSSMLWLAAQTSDSPFLTSPPSARKRPFPLSSDFLFLCISKLSKRISGVT